MRPDVQFPDTPCWMGRKKWQEIKFASDVEWPRVMEVGLEDAVVMG